MKHIWMDNLFYLSIIQQFNYLNQTWKPLLQEYHLGTKDWWCKKMNGILILIHKNEMAFYFGVGTLLLLLIVVGILFTVTNTTEQKCDKEDTMQNPDESTITRDENLTSNDETKIIDPSLTPNRTQHQTKPEEVSIVKYAAIKETPQKIEIVTDFNGSSNQPVSPPCTPIIIRKKGNNDEDNYSINTLDNSTHSFNVVKSRKTVAGNSICSSNERIKNNSKNKNILRNLSTKIKKKKTNNYQVLLDEKDDDDKSFSDIHVVRELDKSLDSISVSSNSVTSNKKKKFHFWKPNSKGFHSTAQKHKSMNSETQYILTRSDNIKQQKATLPATLSNDSIRTHQSE